MEEAHRNRKVILAAAVFLALVALAPDADAQPAAYPTKTVRMVVPFTAGGPVDVPARLVAQKLSEAWGRQVVVDNRAGASGRIGAEFVAKAPPDGYTLLFNNSSQVGNVFQFKKLPYDVITDFAAITQVDVTSGNLMVIHPSIPARSVKEFIALAKARPGQLNYASPGVGIPPHVAAALFAAMAGIDLMHVPYKGTVAGLADVLAGRIEMMMASPSFAIPFIKEGRLRALGICGQRRLPGLPDVPTLNEAGVTGYDYVSWHGMWFPAGVDSRITHRMQAEVAKALAMPDVVKQLADGDMFAVGSSPEQFAAFMKKDLVVQANIMKTIGLQPE